MASAAPRARIERLHVESVGGVAGDMLLAALIDVGADPAALERAYRSLGLPGLSLAIEEVSVGGERALHVRSMPYEGAHGRRLRDVEAVIAMGALSPRACGDAVEVFRLLAAAEAEVHGGTLDAVVLHEVAELDSIFDVVGVSVALESLGHPPLTAAPLPSGRGTVRTAHGLLGVPVPAVRRVVERYGVPLVDVEVQGETVTPTGVALLAHFAEAFSPQPAGALLRTGVGAGTRRFESRPNVVRVHALGGA